MAANLERATEIADDAHYGIKRFDGSDYIGHPLRVMKIMQVMGYSATTQIVAVMHDVAEDCPRWPLERIKAEGFGDDVMVPLELLTKAPDADYDLYIARLAVNPRANAVKRGDLFDNMGLTGLTNPSQKKILNIEKYARAMEYLSRFPQPRV